MDSIQDKLKHFNEVILKDAASERDRILQLVKSHADERIALEKKNYEEQAEQLLKKETALAESEKNSMISRAMIDSRQLLVKTREEIIESLFEETKKLLYEYTGKAEYFSFLSRQVELSCSIAGEGEITVFLSGKDMERFSRRLDEIRGKLPQNVAFERDSADIIGGCKVLNKTRDIVVDNTLLGKLEAKRDTIFEICDLEIE